MASVNTAAVCIYAFAPNAGNLSDSSYDDVVQE